MMYSIVDFLNILAFICFQVCRRWKYLTSVEELWMLKTHEYGQFLIQIFHLLFHFKHNLLKYNKVKKKIHHTIFFIHLNKYN